MRRAAKVSGSAGPSASNNVTRCLRAASSFHLRSRRTISSNWFDRALAVGLGVERQRQIVTRLMIVRIGFEFAFEVVKVARVHRLLAQLHLGLDGADRFVGGAIGPHKLQRVLGPLDITAFQITAREPGHRLGISRLVLQHMGVSLCRSTHIARRKRFIGRGKHALGCDLRPRRHPSDAATKARNCNSGTAPMKPSTGWPSLKA